MNNKVLAGLLAIAIGSSFSLTSCDDVDDPVINTTPILKEVVTSGAEVTATSATVSGTIVGLSGQNSQAYTVGAVYSTSENPTAGGTRVLGALGEDGTTVTTNISGLSDNVTYYYATFATLQGSITQYGEVKSFITTDSEIATAAPAAVEATTANLGGTINGMQDKLDAGSLAYGVIVAPADKPLTDGVKIAATGTDNAFSVPVKGLVPNTAYHFAAYMNVNGADVLAAEQQLTTPVGVDAKAESVDDYVDMGTKYEWCRYNVGAAAEGEAGALLGYGDVAGFNYSTNLSDYATGDIANTDRDAAATSGMGFMPTQADWAELLAVSTIETVENGIKLTSNTTGNSIILPAAQASAKRNLTDSETLAMYWTANACPTNSDYAVLASIGAGETFANALRSTGALVRPVRRPYVNEIEADVTKLAVGDLETNGRIRIEIYNEFGATASAPAVPTDLISFEKQMVIDFTISGITGNLKQGAPESYRAGLEYAASGWSPDYWSSFDGNAQDCIVKGDGNYRVCMNTASTASGAVVFCIDIDGLGANLEDISKVKVEKLTISLDPAQPKYKNVAVDESVMRIGELEKDSGKLRIEFYNTTAEAAGADPYADVVFGQGTTVANVTLTGIDGNLKSGAASSHTGSMSLAAGGWNPSWWGGGASDVKIGGDGTYNFPAYLEANGTGTVVWVIDIVDLAKDLTDISKVSAKVNSVTTPVHAQ